VADHWINKMVDTPTNNIQNQSIPEKTTWTWKDVLAMALGSVALILMGAILIGSFTNTNPLNGSITETPSLIFNAGMAGLEAFGLFASVYLLGIKRRKLSWADVGFRPTTRKWLLSALLLALLFIPIIAIIAMIIQLALGLPLENPQLDFLIPDQFTWLGAIGMLLLGGIIVPIAEELFFRGVLYNWLRGSFGIWVAVPGSALVFGLLHGEISVAGATFVMGLVLAWFYERSNSLWPSILIHVVNNSFKLFLLYVLIAAGYPLSTL
jgi:membrane protease YdiL (CAAX protease family)